MLLSEEKRAEALRILSELYPNPRPELHFTSPYELLVAVMLSAQCTDKQVNKVTAELFRVANTPEQMMALDEDRLMELIHSCGFFRMKGKHILETSRILVEKFGGEVPADRDTLTELPGVGRKTANVVISNAFHIPAIAVDTHVFRVSNRIGLCKADTVEETERQMTKLIPREKWGNAHHWLIWHGRRVCKAQRPLCETCPLRSWKPGSQS